MKLNKKHKAMLASYGRSVLGAVAALYIAGVTDPKELWAALVAALAPVALRAINPNDAAFGRLPKASVIEDALKKVKAPAKKQDTSLTKTEEKLFGITNEQLDKSKKKTAAKKVAKKAVKKKK
jgi:hypothetical protein